MPPVLYAFFATGGNLIAAGVALLNLVIAISIWSVFVIIANKVELKEASGKWRIVEALEQICFEIISNVGGARSSYIEAIDLARKREFEQAQASVKQGGEYFLAGHQAHARLIQKEASKEGVNVSLLLMHAEDQLMSAETFRILADRFMELYQDLEKVG